jgi:hypothetical protein
MGVAVVAAAADVHRPSLFACGYHLLLPGRPPLFATDVRDVFCIFLLSLHIFNVGTPYRQTDDGRQAADVHRPSLFACGCHLLLPGRPPLFATDVRDVFCIFLLSLHIFNVGAPYRQTDDGRQFNHFSIGRTHQYDNTK